ncbi:MAG: N-acetyl-gamma-glutamyl-phosphate reductase [Thermoguttaceae bacterium]
MKKTNVAILGATGYTALELLKILLRHPRAEVVALTSREETRPVDRVHPSLTGLISLPLEDLTPEQVADRAECVFSCLPHTASAKVSPALLERGAKVVDFSADYRLDSPELFREWYDVEHPDPDRLGKVPYGLPELFRDRLSNVPLIANPGCYPTSAILPLAPLLKQGLIEPTGIIIDSKSGVSGAGRKPKLTTLYPECNESLSAYGVGTHRHLPEIDLILSRFGGKTTEVIFTPHLTPMDRGILTTAYAIPAESGITQEKVESVLREQYKDEPFVKIVDTLPGTKDVSGSNRCHIAVRIVRGRIMTISVIDNLIKGASGAAVQNFNILFGYPESTALS